VLLAEEVPICLETILRNFEGHLRFALLTFYLPEGIPQGQLRVHMEPLVRLLRAMRGYTDALSKDYSAAGEWGHSLPGVAEAKLQF